MFVKLLQYVTPSRVVNIYNEHVRKMLVDKDSKAVFVQFFDIAKLMHTTKFYPINYFKYQGYKKESNVEYIRKYMPGMLFGGFRAEYLNDARYCVFADDKYLFHKTMADAHLPTPNLLGVFQNGKILHSTSENKYSILADNYFSKLEEHCIVVKPVIDSCQGVGVNVINIDKTSENKFLLGDRRLSAIEFVVWLNEEYGNSQLLIEEAICQHEFLNNIYNQSVNTVRVDTLRTITGEVIINSAYLRVGRNGRRVDNWSGKLGGIGINIDVNSGLSTGKAIDYSLNLYTHHPDTGVDLTAIKIPYWQEIITLVKQGATRLNNLNSLGWDIAITDNGPLAVEVNADYDIFAQQTCTQSFGSNQSFIKAIREYSQGVRGKNNYAKYFDHWC